jgi:outer membrane receptor protein involved in Fe transport
MRRFLKPLAVALLVPLLLLAAVGDASAVSTTGTLRGRVTDAEGAALPGVTIIARSDALIRERATTSDATGAWTLRDLPPGDYRVVAQMQGYVTFILDTSVELDAVTDLPIAMRAGEISEQITVTAEKPLVDKTTAEVSPSFEPEVTNELPIPRSFNNLLSLAPGVANGGANPNMAGGSSNSNSYIIDGVNSRDPVTGTFGANINFDSIDAVDVKLVGVSAEYGDFQGGVANVVTKSGSNEFTGSLRDEITNAAWTKPFGRDVLQFFSTARQENPTFQQQATNRAASEKSHDLQSTLGGPIVRDNAWFYIAYSRPETRGERTLGNPTGGPLGNGTYVRLFQGDFSLGKVTWQMSNNHRLQGSYQEDPANVPICYGNTFFGGSCYDTYTVDLQSQGGNQYQVLWSATWTPNFQTEAKIGHFENGFNIQPLSPVIPGLEQFIFPSPGGMGAGDGNSPFIDLFTGDLYDAPIFGGPPEQRPRDQAEIKGNLFLSGMGDHSIKMGVSRQEQERVGSSIIAGNALFLGFITGADPLSINDRTYYIFYDYALPSESGPTTNTTAIYVQDDWTVNEHLALGLGVRYDKTDNENDLGEQIIGDSGFAPRLSAAWDFTGEGKYLVKASAARYLAGINLTTISPFVRAAGGQSAYDIYFNANFPNPGTPNWALIGQVRADPDTARFDPNLTPQYLDELSIGYEHLFTPNFGGYIRLIDRSYEDTITQQFSWDYSTGVARKIVFSTNNPDAERTYRAAILQLEKRFSDNWMVMGNYTYSKAEGNIGSDQGFDTFQSYASVGLPQTQVNRFGLLSWDLKHLLKIFGEYRLPLKSTRHSLGIGGGFQWQSGNPYAASRTNVVAVVGPGADAVQDNPIGTRTVDPGFVAGVDQTDTVIEFFEPRGTRKEPDNWQLDMQLNYRLAMSKRVNFETRFTVFNVTDENDPLAVSSDVAPNTAFEDNPDFGRPTSLTQLQRPRRYQVSFAVTW